MTTRELEDALEQGSATCNACRNHSRELAFAQRDLGTSARRAAWRDNARTRAAVKAAKQERDRLAADAQQHLDHADHQPEKTTR